MSADIQHTATVRSFYKGAVAVRSYDVNIAYRHGKDLRIEVIDEQNQTSDFIVIPHEELTNGRVSEKVYDSMYGGRKYKLVYYNWNSYKRQPEEA